MELTPGAGRDPRLASIEAGAEWGATHMRLERVAEGKVDGDGSAGDVRIPGCVSRDSSGRVKSAAAEGI